ncbi:MAG TPA: hypothetical protein VMW38_24985 [Terriglobia bacterium]|nr:hypothetical protein [Terriglobia bacterium]
MFAVSQKGPSFDSQRHIYYFDGRPLVSVTQVLSATGILPSFAFVDKVMLERKRQIGGALHAALHYLQQGDLDENTVDERVKPRLDAYRLFVSDTSFKPIDCELRMYPTVAGMQYGMTLDVTGTIKSQPYLIDFKSADGSVEKGWSIQLAAYEAGIPRPLVPPFRWRRLSLQLKKTGTYAKTEWTDPGDTQEWKSALYLVYRRMARGSKPWEEK